MTTSYLLAFVPSLLFSSRKGQCFSEVTPMGRKSRRGRGVIRGAVKKTRRQIQSAPARKFYAVRYGRDGFAGVLTSWDECTLYVTGTKGAIFKSFKTYQEAHAFAFPPGEGTASTRVQIGATVESGHGDDEIVIAHQTKEAEGNGGQSSLNTAKPAPDPRNKVSVYTDGACSRNGKVGSKAGYGVFFHEHSPYNVSRPLPGPPTNQRAEMTAVLEAMQIILQHGLVSKGGVLEVYTDSMYTKNGIESWTAKWKRNKWKTSQGEDVKNKDLWTALDTTKEALRNFHIEVSLIWVKGHVGNPGNEAADRLAVKGMSRSV